MYKRITKVYHHSYKRSVVVIHPCFCCHVDMQHNWSWDRIKIRRLGSGLPVVTTGESVSDSSWSTYFRDGLSARRMVVVSEMMSQASRISSLVVDQDVTTNSMMNLSWISSGLACIVPLWFTLLNRSLVKNFPSCKNTMVPTFIHSLAEGRLTR